MLSSKQVLDLVRQEPGRGGMAGKLAYARRSQTGSMNNRRTTAAQDRLLADLQHQAQSAPAPRPAYQHPEKVAMAGGMSSLADAPGATARDQHKVLTDSDRLWMSRLPQDPADISHDDAVTLALMAQHIDKGTAPSDHRLVQSIWRPVKEVHDRRAAQAALEAADAAPTPTLPASALNALADAIAAEVPTLQPHEAIARANAALQEVMAARMQAHEDAKMQPQFDNYSSLEATKQRTAVTRDPSSVA